MTTATRLLHSPVGLEAGLQQRLRDELGVDDAEVSIARRSPLGPFAARIVLGRPDEWTDRQRAKARAAELGARLRRLPWVDSVAVRPPRVFATLGDEPLWTHVIGQPARQADGAGRVRIRLGGVPRNDLTSARMARTVEALVGILGRCGWDAAVADSFEAGARHLMVTPVESIDSTVPAAPLDPAWEAVKVGSVEVPRGPMVARYGGVVFEDDVVHELLERRPAPLDPRLPLDQREAWARGLVAFKLLRATRGQHVALTEERLLAGAADAFDTVLRARGLSSSGPSGPSSDGFDADERRILMHVALLPAAMSAAYNALDPSLLIRFVVELAEHSASHGRLRPPGHPVPAAVSAAVGEALHALGIAGADG